jgi:hypothetical protein
MRQASASDTHGGDRPSAEPLPSGSARRAQPVSAPSAADPTWRAYLASTPVR